MLLSYRKILPYKSLELKKWPTSFRCFALGNVLLRAPGLAGSSFVLFVVAVISLFFCFPRNWNGGGGFSSLSN